MPDTPEFAADTPLEIQELGEINTWLNELGKMEPLSDSQQSEQTYRRGFLEGCAFELTRGMAEHPEWWEHACGCESCHEAAAE